MSKTSVKNFAVASGSLAETAMCLIFDMGGSPFVGGRCGELQHPTRSLAGQATPRTPPASAAEIFPQRLALIAGAQAPAALQFRDKEIDDVHHVARRRIGVRDHEAATAAGRLELLLHEIGDLRR